MRNRAPFITSILFISVVVFVGILIYIWILPNPFQSYLKDKISNKLTPKILIVTMYQIGDPLDPKSSGEATIWVQEHTLNKIISIPGAYSPLYCNEKNDLCLVITGVGTTNAAMTMMALGLSEHLDLSNTYVLVAGIAGVSPKAASIESVAFADWIVDTSTTGEYDAREMPQGFEYPKFPYGCAEQWCDNPYKNGTEIYQVNPDLVNWGVILTKDIKLKEGPASQAKRNQYPQETARQFPSVFKCTITGGNTFWHGKLMSDWAAWWVDKWTDGKSNYCMTAVEETGIFPVIHNLGKIGRYDSNRAMLMRVASNYDQQPPTQTVDESLTKALQGVDLTTGMHNLHLVGWTVAKHILNNWDEWKIGIP